MRPFNIEEAKKGAEVVDTEGRDVRLICTNMNNALPVVGIVKNENGYETALFFRSDTTRLFMKPVKICGWQNIYPENLYKTESEAKSMARKECIGQRYIECDL